MPPNPDQLKCQSQTRSLNLTSLVLLFFLVFPFMMAKAQRQDGRREINFSFFNNGIALPFSGKAGVIHQPLHPGISLGLGKRIDHKVRNQFYYNLKFAYVYQQRVQHGLQFYPEIGYRYVFASGFGLGSAIGVGYMHAFRDIEQFELTKDGEYVKVPNIGRPAVMASLSLAISYSLLEKSGTPLRFFTQYQAWFQGPFVKSYVPVLPNGALHIGAAVYLSPKN